MKECYACYNENDEFVVNFNNYIKNEDATMK